MSICLLQEILLIAGPMYVPLQTLKLLIVTAKVSIYISKDKFPIEEIPPPYPQCRFNLPPSPPNPQLSLEAFRGVGVWGEHDSLQFKKT